MRFLLIIFYIYLNEYIYNNNEEFILKYKHLQMFLHDKIEIMVNEKKILKGIFKGINDDGSLILQQGKNILSIYSGQIIL